MPLLAECHECGATQKFADADEGAVARCRQCGASIGVSRKSSRFVPEKKRKKKKPKTERKPAVRLTDNVRKDAVRAGQTGAQIMALAMLANLAAFALLVVSHFTASDDNPHGVVPRLVPPLLGLVSNGLLVIVMFKWRATAEAIERGQVVKVGLILGPALFAVELGRLAGVELELLNWLASYGRMVYFTLLVVYLERVCVLADRSDLQDLANRVLTCGVGVIGIALIQQFAIMFPFFGILALFAMLMVGMGVLWIVWCVEYFRLLMFAISLER